MIFSLINQMFSIFAPSIVAVFLWGIVSRRGTANAAFWTLTAGSLFAATGFIIEKYAVINGITNFISSAEGLGIKDRKCVVQGKSGSVRVELGGRSNIKKKNRDAKTGDKIS